MRIGIEVRKACERIGRTAGVAKPMRQAIARHQGPERAPVRDVELRSRIARVQTASITPGGRGSLKPYEAAFVLRSSEAEVRRQLRRGELTPVWHGRILCVGVLELAQRLEDDLLALEILVALAEGWFIAPRNFSPKLPAPPLYDNVYQLRERITGGRIR